MISTLSIMSFADSDNKFQVLVFGLSVIALNVGLYITIPIIGIMKIRRYFVKEHKMDV